MTFDEIPAGIAVFLDSNTLIYHFTGHPKYGAACTRLTERIERQEIQGFSSAHVLAEVAHCIMTIEAMNLFGWPASGLAARLRKHRTQISQLALYQQAITKVPQMGISILPLAQALVTSATTFSQQYELLNNDALIVAVMRDRGLSHLASTDPDFDRVPGIARYSPA